MISYSMISCPFLYPHEILLVCVLKIYIVIQKHYNLTFTLMFAQYAFISILSVLTLS